MGAETEEDEAYALGRLRHAFELAGWERVKFEMEPVAAAYAYESTLDHDELILIGDFGGGTSDFSLLHVGPGVRRRGRQRKICSATAASDWQATPSMRGSCASWFRRRWGRTAWRARATRFCRRFRRGSTPTWSAGTICRSCARAA